MKKMIKNQIYLFRMNDLAFFTSKFLFILILFYTITRNVAVLFKKRKNSFTIKRKKQTNRNERRKKFILKTNTKNNLFIFKWKVFTLFKEQTMKNEEEEGTTLRFESSS